MVIYNNEFKTKGNKFYNKDKIESQQVHYKATTVTREFQLVASLKISESVKKTCTTVL